MILKAVGTGAGSDQVVTKKTSVDEVITAVCNHYSIGKRIMLGKGRTKTVAYPRHVLMYILRIEMKLSLEEVGRVLDRDHTTIMHGVDKISHLASNNEALRDDLMRIKQLI